MDDKKFNKLCSKLTTIEWFLFLLLLAQCGAIR